MTPRARGAYLLLAAILSAGLLPGAAAAQCGCTCANVDGPFAQWFGRVPPNARFYVYLAGVDPATLRLTRLTSGVEDWPYDLVPVAADVPDTYWLVPRTPLWPGLHELAVEPFVTRFTVEGDADLAAPPSPVAIAGQPRDGAMCTDLVGVSAGIEATPELDLISEVELWRGDALLARRFRNPFFGTATDPSCLGRFHVEGLAEGEDLTARVRVWDLAGNASDFVTVPVRPTLARAGSPAPCHGCAAAPPRRLGAAWPAFALAAALAVRVSRRRHPRGTPSTAAAGPQPARAGRPRAAAGNPEIARSSITTKARIGRLPDATAVADDVGAAIASQGFDELPISVAHAQRAGSLPGPHRDPFDRMLAAQAQIEAVPLLSADAIFDSFGVPRIG